MAGPGAAEEGSLSMGRGAPPAPQHPPPRAHSGSPCHCRPGTGGSAHSRPARGEAAKSDIPTGTKSPQRQSAAHDAAVGGSHGQLRNLRNLSRSWIPTGGRRVGRRGGEAEHETTTGSDTGRAVPSGCPWMAVGGLSAVRQATSLIPTLQTRKREDWPRPQDQEERGRDLYAAVPRAERPE